MNNYRVFHFSFGKKILTVLFLTVISAVPVFSQQLPEGENMINITNRAIISGLLFVPVLTFGYILTGDSAPFNPVLLNIHKLSGLGNLILLNVTAYQAGKFIKLDGWEIAALVFMNVCFAGTIVTGGLVSLDKPMPEFVQWTHKIGPWACAASAGLFLYLLSRN